MATAAVSVISPPIVSTLKAERDRFVAFAFCAADIVVELDTAHRVVFAAGATEALTGASPAALHGQAFASLLSPGDAAFLKRLFAAMPPGQRIAPRTIRVAGVEGAWVPATLQAYRLPDLDDHVFATIRLERGATKTAPVSSATQDAETGLATNDGFAQSIGRRLAGPGGGDLALTLVDLEDFAELRARLGGEAQAELLGAIGSCLRAHAVDDDGAARLDERRFGVVHSRELNVVDLQSGLGASTRALDPTGKGASVIAATLDLDRADINESDTVQALVYTIGRFRNRQAGEFSIRSLSEGLTEQVADTARRIRSLRDQVESDACTIVFQPIVDLSTRLPHHFEALARFNGPHGESPFETIRFAEEVGVICNFDLAMCKRVVKWMLSPEGRRKPYAIATNFSGRSFGSMSFFSGLQQFLSQHPDVRGRLSFEITESAHIDDMAMANRMIRALRDMGFQICLDDFGAGETAFHTLRALDVDAVKIDGSYVREIGQRPRDRAFLKAVAQLCRDLGVDTVAEMIEDEKTYQTMQSCGIHYGQGYYFGRPSSNIGDFDGLYVGAAAKIRGQS